MTNSHNSKRLFLTSSIDCVLAKLADLANLEPSQTKVAFVQNAAIPYGNPAELLWVKKDREAFLKQNYELEDLDISSFNNKIDLENKLQEFQIIHFCGGNTLYLNYLLHQTGLFEIVKKMVTAGKLLYTGSSAGSMIISPDLFGIKDSLLEEIDPKFLEGIQRKDYFGLDLVPFLIIPHTNNPEFVLTNSQMMEKIPNYPHPLIFLNDNQAIWVQNDKFEIIES